MHWKEKINHCIEFKYCKATELSAYQQDLQNFEKEFTYPLDRERRFHISHGDDYAAFFERMGEARFFIGFVDGEIVAIAVVVKKNIKNKKFLYFSDLKVSRKYREYKLTNKLIQQLLIKLFISGFIWGVSSFFFVAMQSNSGVSFYELLKNHWLNRFIKPFGKLRIFLIPTQALEDVNSTNKYFEEKITKHKNLSMNADNSQLFFDLSQQKDLIINNSDNPIKVAHINLAFYFGNKMNMSFLEYLIKVKEVLLSKNQYEYCCFAIDESQTRLLEELNNCAIKSDSRAIVCGFELFSNSDFDYILLNTDEV